VNYDSIRAAATFCLAGLLLALSSISTAADKDKVVWKPIPDAVLQIDSRPPKLWNLYRTGKKLDPLLLQLGTRMLVLYIHDQAIYEIKQEQLESKGEDLWWRESDRPEKPIGTSDWTTKDVGSAWRVQVKLSSEGRLIDIQIPQIPDLRRGFH
jgi:hypothetical protein